MDNTQKTTKLDMDVVELCIIKQCMVNEQYLSSIIDTTKPSFFKNEDVKLVYKIISEFYKKNNALPNGTELSVYLVSDKDKQSFKSLYNLIKCLKVSSERELISNTEQFLKQRSIEEALNTTISSYTSDKNIDSNKILNMFTNACSISLIDSLGHDYFNDIDVHIHALKELQQTIPTGYEWIDNVLGGGLLKDGRALYVFSGVTNSGKSIILGNIATNVCKQNKNVILISLEMSEQVYAKRISSQFSRIPLKDLSEDTELLRELTKKHINNNPSGNLYIKEFSPKSVTTNHIKTYIEKLCKKKSIKPDVIVIDYINLLSPSVHTGSSYNDIKDISEQLRGLSYYFSVPIVTATQLNRGAFKEQNPGMEHTSESMGLSMTADAQFYITSDDVDKELGQIKIGIQKNRFGLNVGKKSFRIDYETLAIDSLDDEVISSEEVKSAELVIKELIKQ